MQREVRQTEAAKGLHGLPLLAGPHTNRWLEREDLGTSLLLCPGKMFRQGNVDALMLLPCFGIFRAI
jgi:hypothetical protein